MSLRDAHEYISKLINFTHLNDILKPRYGIQVADGDAHLHLRDIDGSPYKGHWIWIEGKPLDFEWEKAAGQYEDWWSLAHQDRMCTVTIRTKLVLPYLFVLNKITRLSIHRPKSCKIWYVNQEGTFTETEWIDTDGWEEVEEKVIGPLIRHAKSCTDHNSWDKID